MKSTTNLLIMAKVHPQAIIPSTSCYLTSNQETFTIWMKSLVLSGKGCTVFDANGQIVYRVDNYNCKCSNEVYLMDIKGKVLFTILRKVQSLLNSNHFEKLDYKFIMLTICSVCRDSSCSGFGRAIDPVTQRLL